MVNISNGTYLRNYGGGGAAGSLASVDNVIAGVSETQLFSVSNTELDLEGVTITGGYSGALSGGAISAVDSVVTMTDCVAAGNFADDHGGAVSLQGSRLDIFGLTSFTENNAGQFGGAIRATENSTITVDIDGEANAGSGGVISLSSSSDLIILGKVTFHGNIGGNGGALASWDGSVLNATGELEFDGNQGANGGAMAFYRHR